MKKNYDVERDIQEISKYCALAEIKEFKKNEIITTYISKRNQMCFLLKGEAYLAKFDKDGNRRIIYYLKKNDIFGEALYKLYSSTELFVTAKTDVTVMFLPYGTIENCNKDCTFHISLLRILPDLILESIEKINNRTEILTSKSIKEKLLTYFNQLAIESNSKTFEIPVSLSELADYLVIERTAMMKQLKKMQDEGEIKKNKNRITLI